MDGDADRPTEYSDPEFYTVHQIAQRIPEYAGRGDNPRETLCVVWIVSERGKVPTWVFKPHRLHFFKDHTPYSSINIFPRPFSTTQTSKVSR